jgi:uncharacterized damage-inducible protein DinB
MITSPSSRPAEPGLLEALLDSWDRNHAILVNLLHALPEGGLGARATPDGPTVAQLFMHIHFVRLVFLIEDAPESARERPAEEWEDEREPARIAAMLNESAAAVREAVRGRLLSGEALERHYDHPLLFLQHMIWHEGYHHGQIKLALKVSGSPLADRDAGRVTWGVWMRKQRTAAP